MVLRFASQKLLNLYFKCLVLHLIKYIQRNKESKEKCSGSLSLITAHLCMWTCTFSAVSLWTCDTSDHILTSTLFAFTFHTRNFAILSQNKKKWLQNFPCCFSCKNVYFYIRSYNNHELITVITLESIFVGTLNNFLFLSVPCSFLEKSLLFFLLCPYHRLSAQGISFQEAYRTEKRTNIG